MTITAAGRMNITPASSSPRQPARSWPRWMASSVEFGPGIRLVAPIRSTNRSSVSQLRRWTSSWRIIAVCAAGPPKATTPSRRKTRATSRAGPNPEAGRDPVTTASFLPMRVAGITTRVAGSPHAWNQPHSGRGRNPRLPPGRHVVLHRPGPHDERHHVRLHHDDRLQLPRARCIDLRRPRGRDHPRDHAQRRARRRLGVRRQPDRAERPGRRQHPRGQGRLHLLPHG